MSELRVIRVAGPPSHHHALAVGRDGAFIDHVIRLTCPDAELAIHEGQPTGDDPDPALIADRIITWPCTERTCLPAVDE